MSRVEVPRRSFLALLGAAVAAAAVPKLPTLAEAAPAPAPIKSEPVTFVRRWYVKGVQIDGLRTKVTLGESLMTEQAAKDFRATPIDLKDVLACQIDQPTERWPMADGTVGVSLLPATAEIEMGMRQGLDIQRRVMAGLDFVEFVGEAAAP